MIKCFWLALGFMFCTDSNIDVRCMETELLWLTQAHVYIYKGIDEAASQCLMTGQGCCSWHGGIDHFSQDEGVYVCVDGTDSKTCRR